MPDLRTNQGGPRARFTTALLYLARRSDFYRKDGDGQPQRPSASRKPGVESDSGAIHSCSSVRVHQVSDSYGWRWLALFPHHGPGRKHERKIALLDWQRAIVDMCPVDFLGGLVDSDGCRSVRHQDGKDYPFYSFDNRSLDILSLFCETCDKLGVHYSRPKVQTVSVARRADVAYLDSVLARKS